MRAHTWVLWTWLMTGCVGVVGVPDGGAPVDAGVEGDDAGVDAGTDAGSEWPDAGAIDAGQEVDAGVPELVDPCAAWDDVFPEGAFTVTPADKANLQTLLDTHQKLRLSPGDYRQGGPSSIRLSSGQEIVSLVPSNFPDVVVAAGTQHSRLQGLNHLNLSYEPGAPIRYNCVVRALQMKIVVNGATVERNVFIGLREGSLVVDTSTSGRFSENRFIKFNSHTTAAPIDLKGDVARSSRGNVFLLTDAISPRGSAFKIDGQRDISFVGVNVEGYNSRSEDPTPAVFKVTNTGTFVGYHATGILRHATSVVAPTYVFDAERLHLHALEAPDGLRIGPSNEFLFSWRNGYVPSDIDDGAPNALRFSAQQRLHELSVNVDGAPIVAPPASATNDAVRAFLLPSPDERPGEPWALPTFAAIPDALGPNWANGREARPDESDAIQALVNAQGVAQLEARTYYVSKPILFGKNQGLVGAGAGKTAIVATSDNVDLIRLEWGVPAGVLDDCAELAGFTLANLTLQGGRYGVHSDFPGNMVHGAVLSHVTFRNMTGAGIFVDRAFGWDNNFIEYVNYVDCRYGVRQEGKPRDVGCNGSNEWTTMSYMDKTVFYRNQFVRCGQAISLRPTRGNHLNGVVESSFRDNTEFAVEFASGNHGVVVANSEFINNAGNPVARASTRAAFVNCSFTAGQGLSMIGPHIDMEGCTFLRGGSTNATVFGNVPPGDRRDPHFVDLANSRSELPLGPVATTIPIAGLYFNNSLPDGEPFSAFMTALEYRAHGTPSTADDSRDVYPVLTGSSSPGSQLLFGVPWRE